MFAIYELPTRRWCHRWTSRRSVDDPQEATNPDNKDFVDKKTIKKQSGGWVFNGSDEVNLRYMHENVVSLRTDNDVFIEVGKRITNLADGSAINDI